MDTVTWSTLLDRLHRAIEDMDRLLDGRAPGASMRAAEHQALERAFDDYLTADEEIARYVEDILHRSARRPRR